MRLILTDDPTNLGERSVFSDQCDCDCACPVDGMPTPVLSLPVAYYLELTPACNNRCPGCGNVYAMERREGREGRGDRCAGYGNVYATTGAADRVCLAPPLDGEEWCDLIAVLASHARQFKVTGGEATLHPALAEIVRAIAGQGIPFTLFTNGRWSRPGALIQLLRELPLFEGFLVSLHGPDADAHEAFSGVPGSFAETVSNVRRAVDAGLDVAISAVIHQGNWDRIPETLDVAIGLGAHHLVCNRSIGAPLADVTPSRAQLRAAIAAIESHRQAGHPIRFGNCIPQCFAPSSSRGCTAGSTFATVDPWGRMRPCNHAPLVAGDLRTQPVPEVWWGERMAAWRSLVPVSCAFCAAFAACHGGCRAQALLTGQAQDPLIQGSSPEVLPFLDEERFLYGGLRPVGRFVHRFEGDAGVLIHKSQVAPVPPGCDALWPKLDGSLTLRQIEGQYGDLALSWVGALYEQEMVIWDLE